MITLRRSVRLVSAVLLLTCCIAIAAADGPPMLRIEAGGHTSAVRQVLFADSGRKLVSVGSDKVVRVWDVEQAAQIGQGLRYPIGAGPQGGLYAAALSRDGKLAIGGYDVEERGTSAGELGRLVERRAVLRVFDLAGTSMRTLETPHRDLITSLAFSPDGTLMASGSVDGKAVLWDAGTMRPARTLAHPGVVSSLCFSPDGSRLATACYDGSVRLWDTKTGQQQASLANRAPVQCIAWSSDGSNVAAGSLDARIHLWDPATSRERTTLTQADNPTSLAFSSDGAWLLSGSGETAERNDRKVRVWDVAAGTVLREYAGHTATIFSVAFAPNGRNLAASADLSGSIHLWNPSTGETSARLKGSGASIYSVGWSRDGKGIAWGTTEARSLQYSFRLDQAAPGPDVKAAAAGDWQRAQTTRDNVSLSIANPAPANLNDRAAVVMTAAGRETRRIQAEPRDRVNACCYTSSGDIVVGSDFGLALYSASGKLSRRFTGHTGSVLDVAVSANGDFLASASADQTIRIWSLKDAGRGGAVTPLLSLFAAADGRFVAWCEDGYYAASPTGDDIIGWQVDRGASRPAELRTAFQMHEAFYRPDVVSLLLEAGSVKEALRRAAKPQVLPPAQTAAEAAVQLPGVELVEVGPAARQGEEWVTKSQTVKLRVRVSNMEASDTLTLSVNRPSTSKRLLEVAAAPRPDERILDATLAQGANVLTVVGKNRAGESQPLSVRVTWDVPAAERKPESLYVLAVGVSRYSDPKIDSLRFADKDADDLAAFYRGQGGKLFSTVKVDSFTNDRATRPNVLSALEGIRAAAGDNDTAIIYVSSHGFEDKGAFYFALADAARDRLADTGVSWQEILKRLQTLNARNVLLVVDQCYSGGVQEELVRGYRPANEALRSVRLANVLTFAASTADELSWEHPKWQHGAFTYALLMALRGQAPGMQYPEGRVLLNKVEDFVVDEVQQIVMDTVGSRQTPSLFTLPGVYKRIPIAHVP